MDSHDLRAYIDHIQDFPQSGIGFKDIGPLLENCAAMAVAKAQILKWVAPIQADVIAGLDARGFLFSTLIADALGIGSVMIRKAGKLPGAVEEKSYSLEYGSGTLAVQKARDLRGKRVVIIDDLLATGGTLGCAENLITQAGGEVAAAVVIIELKFLEGADQLKCPLHSLVSYDE
jgi:adenine phosphoribosyltransferase